MVKTERSDGKDLLKTTQRAHLKIIAIDSALKYLEQSSPAIFSYARVQLPFIVQP